MFKKLLIPIMLLCLVFSAQAVNYWTPPANIDLKNVYSVYNASNICIGSDCRGSWPGGSGSSGGWVNDTNVVSLYNSSNNVSSGVLFVDNTNSRVTIGNITNTRYALQVAGYTNLTGNSSVDGYLTIDNRNLGALGLTVQGTNPGVGFGIAASIARATSNAAYTPGTKSGDIIIRAENGGSMYLSNATITWIMMNVSTGFVGIGTKSPTTKLDVTGSVNVSATMNAFNVTAGNISAKGTFYGNIYCFLNNTCIQNVSIPFITPTTDVSKLQLNNLTNTNASYNASANNFIFDGLTSYMNASNSSSLNIINNNWTYSAWFYLNNVPTVNYQVILVKPSSANNIISNAYGYRLIVDTSGNLQPGYTNGTSEALFSSPIVAGKWYHALVTINDSAASLWINGTLKNQVASRSGVASVTSSPLFIGGALGTTNAQFFNGTIKDVRIWNSSMNSSQIASVYNNDSVLPDNLVAYYPFINQSRQERLELDLDTNRNLSIINGSLAIGTTQASAPLTVNGSVVINGSSLSVDSTSGLNTFLLRDVTFSKQSGSYLNMNSGLRLTAGNGINFGAQVLQNYAITTDFNLKFMNSSQAIIMYMNSTTNNIGIGTISPTQKLDVNGTANVSSYICRGVPLIVNLTGAGAGPTISITGTDCGGTINLTTGTLPVLSADIFQVTFGNARPNGNYGVVLFPANAATQTLNGVSMVGSDILNSTDWSIQSGTSSLTGSTAYAWRYVVMG